MEEIINKELLGDLQGTCPKPRHITRIDNLRGLVNLLLTNRQNHHCNVGDVGNHITTRIADTKIELNNFKICKKPPQWEI